jgi:hypothetical protein
MSRLAAVTSPSGQAGPGEVSGGSSDHFQVGSPPMLSIRTESTGEEDAHEAIPKSGSLTTLRLGSITKDGIREPWQFNL